MAEPGEKKEEESKKIVHTYPLVRVVFEHRSPNIDTNIDMTPSMLKKYQTKNCDMGDEMKTEAMELCVTACEKHAANNEAAARMIKEMMDKKFGPSWHAVVGEGYGFEISYECKSLLYMFFGGNVAICIWKCS